MGVIILTFFACVWIGVVCKVLGLVQNKYQQLKTEKRKSIL